MLEYRDTASVLAFLCKQTGKWGMYISGCELVPWEERRGQHPDAQILAAPYLGYDRPEPVRVVEEGGALVPGPTPGDLYQWERSRREEVTVADGALMQILCDGFAFLLFDTEEELDRYFHLTIGDDGPTGDRSYELPEGHPWLNPKEPGWRYRSIHLNEYEGHEYRWYAMTCNPDGIGLTENT